MSRFDAVPTINRARTRFNLSFDNKTSMTIGKLYPIYVQEVYPGDSFKCDAKFVARTSSAYLRPVMDVVNCDTYFFFVPNRLVFDAWAKVFGESDNKWAAQTETKVARTSLGAGNNGAISEKTVADYMGLPLLSDVPDGINILPIRAFALIYDQYFRDENFIDPMLVQKGDQNSSVEVFNNSDWSPSNYFGKLPKVARYHDYFSSCLPSPQKSNSPVIIPFSTDAKIPVYPMARDAVPSSDDFPDLAVPEYSMADSRGLSSFTYTSGAYVGYQDGQASDVSRRGSRYDSNTMTGIAGDVPFINNLFGNPEGVGPDVSDLRTAVQLQKMLERDARGGTRYTEYITAAFGVSSPDARLQRPEFLGGARVPLNVQQVAQTSESSNASALGELGAYSWTNGNVKFAKAFTEHGYIIGVSCLRFKHNYQQGIERMWLKTERMDFMDPVFAHLSEQPVYKSEIYALDASSQPDLKADIFGYNEIYADLRFRPNKITGEMRTNATATQDIWHFGDWYETRPSLNETFINETPAPVDRTMAVSSVVQDQFIFDWFFKQSAVRVLPMYGTPGLVDHG